MAEVLAEAGLQAPAPSAFRSTGRRGVHSEHMGYLLAEMQHLQRSLPRGRVVSLQPVAGTPADQDAARVARAWTVLQGVPDPEVPVISVCDLGIVRDVTVGAHGALEVVLTPTYSGCPATEVIERSVLDALAEAGLGPATATTRRQPAWTTDWITEDGRRKLREYGIAPPGPVAAWCAGSHPPGGAAQPAAAGGLPALRQRTHRAPVGLRLHRLQGLAPLPGLPRAL